MLKLESNSGKTVRMRALALAAAGVLCATGAMAQTQMGGSTSGQQSNTPATAPGPDGTMSNADKSGMDKNGGPTGDITLDKMFVRRALQGGMAEIELSQLALTKSNNADVKNFAQKMVDDHTKLGDDMKAVAQQVGVNPPDKLTKKDMATKAKLEAMNGTAFDQAYIKDMLKDHEQDVKDFKSEAQTASLPAVKDAAAKGEPVISMHLDMVKQLAQSNNVASK